MNSDRTDEDERGFYDRRRMWAEYISTHPAVTDRAFRVGFWLSRRMNATNESCWYSKREIARQMGKSHSYVERALAELKAANVMVVKERKGRPNIYFLHAPFF